MKASLRPPERPINLILGSLPAPIYARLLPHLERVELEQGEVMYDFDKPIEYAYFPETLVSSLVHPLADNTAVESTTVGSEGVCGVALFLGGDRMAAQEFCQIGGEALRLPAAVFRRESRDGAFREVMERYTLALLTQVAMTAVCNGAHNIEQRCARWLLHTRDRLRSDELPLTQKFLAHMLGVRRATVNEVLGRFERAGILDAGYARIHIIARDRLESTACECYKLIVREFDRLLRGRETPNPLAGVRTQENGKSTLQEPNARLQPG